MVDESLVHTNSRDRETRAVPCGELRVRLRVTGDPKRVTCPACKDAAK